MEALRVLALLVVVGCAGLFGGFGCGRGAVECGCRDRGLLVVVDPGLVVARGDSRGARHQDRIYVNVGDFWVVKLQSERGPSGVVELTVGCEYQPPVRETSQDGSILGVPAESRPVGVVRVSNPGLDGQCSVVVDVDLLTPEGIVVELSEGAFRCE